MGAPDMVGRELPTGPETLTAETQADEGVAAGGWERFEALLGRASDWLNPILIKESRQAMKSRQFSITFTLLLVAAVGWSIIGITWMMPRVYYAPGGPFLLTGYFFILATAVLIVVPFMAYRSLAAELEDGTYELLSITSLSARHLVTGKLGSAVVQMLVYYSAIAPCVAFTYLLRGVNIFTLVLMLLGTFVNSVLLCAVGLVLASLTRGRQWQLLLSIVFLAALGGAYTFWSTIVVAGMIDEGVPFQAPEFWIVLAILATGYVTYFAILILLAAALNSFPSENRSTKIRIALLVQTILFVGWMFYAVGRYGVDDEPINAMLVVGLGHWAVCGMLLTGESPQLSPRVKRQLPATLLGRTFLTLLNPGSATGYAFAVASAGALALVAVGGVVFSPSAVGAAESARVFQFAGLGWGYLAAYLGLGRLLLIPFRRLVPQGMAIVLLIHLLLLLAGVGIPMLIAAYNRNLWSVEYNALHITNWMWTLEETLDQGMGLYPPVLLGVPLAGVVILLLNLVQGAPEFRQVRQALPARVRQEEQPSEALAP